MRIDGSYVRVRRSTTLRREGYFQNLRQLPDARLSDQRFNKKDRVRELPFGRLEDTRRKPGMLFSRQFTLIISCEFYWHFGSYFSLETLQDSLRGSSSIDYWYLKLASVSEDASHRAET